MKAFALLVCLLLLSGCDLQTSSTSPSSQSSGNSRSHTASAMAGSSSRLKGLVFATA